MSLVLVGTPGQTAVLAHWKFDEGTSNGGEVTVDELGNHNGTYLGGFFATGNLFRTGGNGTPSAAVKIAQGYSLPIAAPPDPNLIQADRHMADPAGANEGGHLSDGQRGDDNSGMLTAPSTTETNGREIATSGSLPAIDSPTEICLYLPTLIR